MPQPATHWSDSGASNLSYSSKMPPFSTAPIKGSIFSSPAPAPKTAPPAVAPARPALPAKPAAPATPASAAPSGPPAPPVGGGTGWAGNAAVTAAGVAPAVHWGLGQAGIAGATGTAGRIASGVLGKASLPLTGAAALGDAVGLTPFELATGRDSLANIQHRGATQPYLQSAGQNLMRPGKAIVGLGDALLHNNVATQAIEGARGYGLDRQIQNRQNTAQAATAAAMRNGVANQQQLADAMSAAQRERADMISARWYKPWLWRAS